VDKIGGQWEFLGPDSDPFFIGKSGRSTAW
jgi:hypothetical protein